jgi:hypothetical protein
MYMASVQHPAENFQCSTHPFLSKGFDLSAMSEHVYDDAVVDVVGPESLVSEPFVIKVSFWIW